MTDKVRTIPVNGELLRISRLEMGLSLREFSKFARTSISALNSIEKRNEVIKTTSILELQRVAAACGISLADFLTPENQQQSPKCESDIHVIARSLAVILARDNRLHNKTMLLDHFNITYRTLNRAIALLNDLAAPLGLRVHQYPSIVGLRPLETEAQQHFKKIDRRRANTDGYTMTDATLIHQALRGTLTESPTHAERPRLGRLIRLGTLRPGNFGEPMHVLTDQAAFAFDIPGIDIDVEHAPSLIHRRPNGESAGTQRTKSLSGTRVGSARQPRKKTPQ